MDSKYIMKHPVKTGLLFLLFTLAVVQINVRPASATKPLLIAKAPDIPNQQIVSAAGKDCRQMISAIKNLIAELDRAMPGSSGDATENKNSASPPTGMLNGAYMPLHKKVVAKSCDRIREYAPMLEDELLQMTAHPSLQVFQTTKDIKSAGPELESSKQRLMSAIASSNFDRKTASDDAKDLLAVMENLENLLLNYHSPLK